MLRHVVLLRFKDGTTPDQRRAIRAGLAELPARIPEIRDYRFGDDAGIAAGNFDFAIVADFDDRGGFERYAADAAHQKLIAEHIRPVLAERAAAQFEI